MMDGRTQKAKDVLTKNGYTCVLYSDNEEHHSTQRGVKPLLDFLESGKDFSGFFAADKTVGQGAAHLYILLGVRSLWANVISYGAKALLERHCIEVFYETAVPFIINRAGNGACPIESAVKGITCSKQALHVIRETLERIKKEK